MKEREANSARLEENIALKDQEIRDLKIKIEEKQAEIESLHTRFEAEFNSQKEDMQLRLDNTIESNNQKDTRISQLEEQLTALKDQIASLDTELVLKNDQIIQNTVKLDKIQKSTNLFTDEITSEPLKNSCYRMKNGEICEINDEEDQIKVIQRQKDKERDDFIFWVGNKQLCGVLKDNTWTLSLYSGYRKVDSLEIEGSDRESDKFYLKGNKIYIGVYDSYELYRVTVEGDKMQVESFGQTSGYLCSLCEYEDYLFIGLGDNTVRKVKDGKFTEILEMSCCVGYLRIEGDYLLICDYYGQAAKYNLISKTTEKTVKLEGDSPFLFDDKIVSSDGTNLYIYDWDGFILEEFIHNSGYNFCLLKQTDKYSVVAGGSCLLIIDHTTLTVKDYEGGGIPRRYLDYD